MHPHKCGMCPYCVLLSTVESGECMYVHTIHACVTTYIRAYVHQYVHMYVCTLLVCTYIRTYTCLMTVYFCLCCVPPYRSLTHNTRSSAVQELEILANTYYVEVCTYVHKSILTYIQYIYERIRMYVRTYVRTYVHTVQVTCILLTRTKHTCVYAYIHT